MAAGGVPAHAAVPHRLALRHPVAAAPLAGHQEVTAAGRPRSACPHRHRPPAASHEPGKRRDRRTPTPHRRLPATGGPGPEGAELRARDPPGPPDPPLAAGPGSGRGRLAPPLPAAGPGPARTGAPERCPHPRRRHHTAGSGAGAPRGGPRGAGGAAGAEAPLKRCLLSPAPAPCSAGTPGGGTPRPPAPAPPAPGCARAPRWRGHRWGGGGMARPRAFRPGGVLGGVPGRCCPPPSPSLPLSAPPLRLWPRRL